MGITENLCDWRKSIWCNGRNVSLGFHELKRYSFVQFLQAAQRDNVDCVSLLLKYNADATLFDSIGHTVFHHAVSRGNVTIAKMLHEHNINIEAKTEVKSFKFIPIALLAVILCWTFYTEELKHSHWICSKGGFWLKICFSYFCGSYC